MKYSLEAMFTVCNDDLGDRIEVGCDRDGLDMTELRYVTDEGKITADIRVSEEGLPLLIEALQKHLDFKRRQKLEQHHVESTG